MSCRDWLRSAIERCLIIAVCFLSLDSHAQNNPHQDNQIRKVEKDARDLIGNLPIWTVIPDAIDWKKSHAEVDWRNPRCNEAQSHDESDLCEQRRMAKAAEESLTLNKIQIVIGISGFIALLLTIRLSRKATLAAIAAADAADAAVKTAQQSAALELRPYVSLSDFNWQWLSGPDDPNKIVSWRLVLVWKNSGQTPAKNVRTWLSVDTFDLTESPAGIDYPDKGNFLSAGNPLGPGQTLGSRVEVPLENFVAAWEKTKALYYWGWVEYDGIDTEMRHRTEICARLLVGSDPKIEGMKLSDLISTPFNAMDNDCVQEPKTF